MHRNKVVRLSEGKLRTLVRTLIAEARMVQHEEHGARILETDLGFEHQQSLQEFMEEAIENILSLGIVDRDEEDEESLRFEIFEEGGLLMVELMANTIEGLDALEAQVENYEEDEVFEKEANQKKADEIIRGKKIQGRMDKHLVKTPTPSWGSAMPSGQYGKN